MFYVFLITIKKSFKPVALIVVCVVGVYSPFSFSCYFSKSQEASSTIGIFHPIVWSLHQGEREEFVHSIGY